MFYIFSLLDIPWCHVFKPFWVYFCMVWGCVLTSLISMQLSNCPSITCWRNCLISTLYSSLLCGRFIDFKCVGLSLGSLFCSTDTYGCFCTKATLLLLLKLCCVVWSLRETCFLFPPVRIIWAILSFMVSYKSLDYLFYFCEICCG